MVTAKTENGAQPNTQNADHKTPTQQDHPNPELFCCGVCLCLSVASLLAVFPSSQSSSRAVVFRCLSRVVCRRRRRLCGVVASRASVLALRLVSPRARKRLWRSLEKGRLRPHNAARTTRKPQRVIHSTLALFPAAVACLLPSRCRALFSFRARKTSSRL